MPSNQNPIESIAKTIESKSAIKQKTYRTLCKNFKDLENEAKNVIKQISDKIVDKDKDIELSVTKISNQEFQVRIAGDMLVFLLHTNIITLDDTHGFSKSPYVQQEPLRKYLGQINIYNFMADSLKFNRLNDPGYLVARVFCNYENHFLVEGERQLNFMFEKVSPKPLTKTDLSIIIQLVISQSIESDLITSPFPSIRVISLNEKLENTQALGGGHKIGFQMSYQQRLE